MPPAPPPSGDRAEPHVADAADASHVSDVAARPPRPLWLTETYPPSRGGMAQSCDRIVHALRTLGVSVDVVYFDRRAAPAPSPLQPVATAIPPAAAAIQAAPPAPAAIQAAPAGLVAGAIPPAADIRAAPVGPAAGAAPAAPAIQPVPPAPAAPVVVARQRGRDFRWPVEPDPAHALRSFWSRLQEDPERQSLTHVVAFGGQLPLLAGPVFAAWLGVPLVTLLRGNDLDTGLFHPQRAGAVHRALERSARVCAVSRDKAEQVAALLPGGPAVAVIHTGIDLARWAPVAADLERAAAWRRALPPGRRVLGFFGEIKRKKGAILLLEALCRGGFAERFHLRFAGELEDEVTAWLAEHGAALSYGIEPFDDRYRLLERYPACDLVALPSFYDGTPNVLAEAAALGVPLLAARTGGMADLLADGRHGFLFAPGSEDELAAALGRAAAASDEDLRRMGAACRDLARTRLDHMAEAAAYLGVLRETQGAGGQAGAAAAGGREPDRG
jgi:glycogen(starch) synthase